MFDPTNPPNWENKIVIATDMARLVCPAWLRPIQTAIQGERQYIPPVARQTPMYARGIRFLCRVVSTAMSSPLNMISAMSIGTHKCGKGGTYMNPTALGITVDHIRRRYLSDHHPDRMTQKQAKT